LDGRVSWNLADGRTTLTLWGTNLTDKDYIYNMLDLAGDEQVGGIDPGLGYVADYWGQPRHLGIEWRKSF